MAELMSLWLPILLSAVAVFFLSYLAWGVLRYHESDVRYYPKQDELMEHIRANDIAPGMYLFPNCADRKDMTSETHKQRMETGPWGTLKVWPHQPSMVRGLMMTLSYILFCSVMVGYVTSEARDPGSSFVEVFQVAMTAAAMLYVVGGWLNNIWFGKSLRFLITDAFDGLVYSAATGVLFALLWPES